MTNFTAYIISYLPDDAEKRADRLAIHNTQIDWWLDNTAVDIHIIAMNYQAADIEARHSVTGRVVHHKTQQLPCSAARKVAFERFYASQGKWGIIMDNDAWLYSEKQHNSGAALLAEMDKQIEQYDTLGMFFPINPQKAPFSEKLASERHTENHVFVRSLDLKGSMCFVRNFRRYGQTEVYPDPSYGWCEDGKLALDAIAAGHRVMVCENIVLNEKTGNSSSFADTNVDRKPFMREANERIASQYAHLGLAMRRGEKNHLLDTKGFLTRCWKGTSKLTVPKDVASFAEAHELFTF